jgi:hypothetical protein
MDATNWREMSHRSSGEGKRIKVKELIDSLQIALTDSFSKKAADVGFVVFSGKQTPIDLFTLPRGINCSSERRAGRLYNG